MPKRRSLLVIGHRGDGAGPDENTLASCRRAIAAGADAVELDVRVRGGELVVGHGRRGRGRAARLNDVLPKLPVPVVLHLKRSWFNPGHDRRALTMIASLRHRPGLTLTSFWPGTLTAARRRHPDLRTGFITYWAGWDLHFARRLGARDYYVWQRSVTRRAIHAARRKRVNLIAFNAPWERRRAIRTVGLRGVITDNVARIKTSSFNGER